MDELIPLELVEKGRYASVEEICGDAALVSRLAEMGVRAGCRIRVLQTGSPCLLEVGDCRLSLRGEVAFQILVRPLA